LLHLLGGIDRPTEGTVTIDGTDLYSLAPDPLTVFRRRYIGFVFQSYNLIPGLNIWENITLPLGLDNLKADREEIEHLLSTLGIYEKRYSMPSQLSGGQQQRVAIARALATKPHIVLADEPTGNLDSRTSLEVMLLLEKLNRSFCQTIIMITHNEELAQMASRRIRIEDGRIVSDSVEGRL
jgi:putative ABC transport system ATP-binding protein